MRICIRPPGFGRRLVSSCPRQETGALGGSFPRRPTPPVRLYPVRRQAATERTDGHPTAHRASADAGPLRPNRSARNPRPTARNSRRSTVARSNVAFANRSASRCIASAARLARVWICLRSTVAIEPFIAALNSASGWPKSSGHFPKGSLSIKKRTSGKYHVPQAKRTNAIRPGASFGRFLAWAWELALQSMMASVAIVFRKLRPGARGNLVVGGRAMRQQLQRGFGGHDLTDRPGFGMGFTIRLEPWLDRRRARLRCNIGPVLRHDAKIGVK